MTQLIRVVFVVLSLAGIVSGAQAAVHHYTVQVDEALSSLDVRACFESPLPRALEAFDSDARRQLRGMRVISAEKSRRITPHGQRVSLTGLRASDCVEYAVVLDTKFRLGWRSGLRRTADSLLISPHLWLWFPASPGREDSIELSFEHPDDMSVSAPWSLLSREPGRTAYRLGGRPYYWEARMAIGRFPVEEIRLPGGSLRLAVLDGSPPADHEAMWRWVEEGARALTSVGGRMPVPSVQVLVVPIGRGGEPVPWGQVMRGGGEAVHLYVDQRRPFSEFRADWTLMHELSHLLHPRIAGHDAWLYEGLASYYQNVLRARAGLLGPQEAWEELHAGFERGIRGTPSDRTLAEVSENMPYNHLYMRVYWSGAAVALLADTELRARSGGRESLDSALAAFAACCMPSDRIWSGPELMARLDQLTDSEVFTRLYMRHAHSPEFPDLATTYRRLGLSPSYRGLRLLDDAPDAQMCRDIMRPTGERS